jgi:hypothetical protein
MSITTKQEALDALESMGDFARMNVGVEADGHYKLLKQFILDANHHQTRMVVANDTIREIIEDAHIAGQEYMTGGHNKTGAKTYCDKLFFD